MTGHAGLDEPAEVGRDPADAEPLAHQRRRVLAASGCASRTRLIGGQRQELGRARRWARAPGAVVTIVSSRGTDRTTRRSSARELESSQCASSTTSSAGSCAVRRDSMRVSSIVVLSARTSPVIAAVHSLSGIVDREDAGEQRDEPFDLRHAADVLERAGARASPASRASPCEVQRVGEHRAPGVVAGGPLDRVGGRASARARRRPGGPRGRSRRPAPTCRCRHPPPPRSPRLAAARPAGPGARRSAVRSATRLTSSAVPGRRRPACIPTKRAIDHRLAHPLTEIGGSDSKPKPLTDQPRRHARRTGCRRRPRTRAGRRGW